MEVEFEDYYLDFPDDVEDDEIVSFLSDLGDSISTYFMGEPIQPPIYSDAGGSFQQVQEQTPLATEEATRSWEPYITGGAARDFVVGSELLARNLAGQRADAPEDIAGAMAATGVTGAATQFPAKTTPGTVRSMFGPKSKLWNKKVLEHAENWEQMGVAPKDILDQTGYFRGLDGEWLLYKPNKSFMEGTSMIDEAFKNQVFLDKSHAIETTLGQLLPKDDPIRQAYGRAINNIKVKVEYYPNQKGSSGKFDKDGILIRAKDPETAKQTIIHEAQHAIQELENMKGKGANSESFYDAYTTADDLTDKNAIRKIALRAQYDWDRKLPPGANIKKLSDKLKEKFDLKNNHPLIKQLLEERKKLVEKAKNKNRWRRYETEYGEAMARINEAWAKGPLEGMPFDEANLTAVTQKTYRNSGLDPNRITRPEDIHFDQRDKGVFTQRQEAKRVRESLGVPDPEDFQILPEDFGGLTD